MEEMSARGESTSSKIAALMARALHEGTPIEEARSSAMAAVKLIAALGIFVTSNNSDPEIVRLRAQWPGTCKKCKVKYQEGALIWRITGRRGQTFHDGCEPPTAPEEETEEKETA